MFQGKHSAILLTFIKLPFVIKIFVLSVFEWPFYTGLTVCVLMSLVFPKGALGWSVICECGIYNLYRLWIKNG